MSREELLKEIHECEQWIEALKKDRWPRWEWIDELEARLVDLNASCRRRPSEDAGEVSPLPCPQEPGLGAWLFLLVPQEDLEMLYRDNLLYTFRRVISFTVWYLGNQDPDWPDEGASFAEADVNAQADYVGRQNGRVLVEHLRRREEIIWN